MIKYLLTIGALMATSNASSLSLWDVEPHDVRTFINQKIFEIEAEKPDVRNVTNLKIKRGERTTPLRIYTPNGGEPLPLILLIHGGAWVAGNLDTHDNLARYLCREAQALVVSVEYLNSPEGKFPFPMMPCFGLSNMRRSSMQIRLAWL
jgi:acetyl esterase